MNPSPLTRPVELMVIGCSSGGFDALCELLPAFSSNTLLSIAIVIHQGHQAKGHLAELFASRCALPVKEAEDKEDIRPGTVYFAPPGYHLLIETDLSFSLSVEEPVNFSRPSIDVLFESAAMAYRDRLVGLVLTGASSDGAFGLEQVLLAGGTGIVQDPVSALSPLMPQSALDRVGSAVMILDIPRMKLWLSNLSKQSVDGPGDSSCNP